MIAEDFPFHPENRRMVTIEGLRILLSATGGPPAAAAH